MALSSQGLADLPVEDMVESEIIKAMGDGGIVATDEKVATRQRENVQPINGSMKLRARDAEKGARPTDSRTWTPAAMLRKVFKERWYINDPEDIEGLLVTLGVISALIFANIIALQCSIVPAEMARGDFACLLRSSPEFRQFAKTIWAEGNRTFEARIGVGPNETFDIRTVLDNPSGVILEWSTHESREFATTFQYMEADFPKAKMQVWKTWRGVRTGEHGGSDYLTTTGTLAYVLVALALFNSVTMYVSFAYSPVKEDYEAAGEKARKTKGKLEPPASLVKWTETGMPVILFSYFLLITGVVAFACSTCSVNHIRYLFTSQAWFSQRMQFFCLIPALVLFTFALPIWAFVSAGKSEEVQGAGKSEEVQKAEGCEDEVVTKEVHAPVAGKD